MKKIALITGASRGMGKVFTEIFARQGYSLILIARSLNELSEIQNVLKQKYQCDSKILSVDLAEPGSVDFIVSTFKDELSEVEVLVNNAGFGAAKKFTEMTPEEVKGMIAVNITALTQLTYRILPYMLAKKNGKILNLASLAAFLPGPYMAEYYASKAYVLSFSQALNEEFRREGVTVSVLCPGPTATDFAARSGSQNTLLFQSSKMQAENVVEIGVTGLMKQQRVIISGFKNKMVHIMLWLTPPFLAIKIAARLNKLR